MCVTNLIKVPGWEQHYLICEDHQEVYSRSKRGKLRKMKLQRGREYLEIKFRRKIDGKRIDKHYLASRVFLAAYTQTSLGIDKDAHHKNGNRDNLSRKNLMWLTRKQNVSKYYKTGKVNCDIFSKQQDDPF